MTVLAVSGITSLAPADTHSQPALQPGAQRVVHPVRAAGVRAYIPHRSAWLCIHRYEGSWTDSGDPYWGGLQMDRTFMLMYAPRWLLAKGWANRWSPTEQMMVAERAWRTRGFYPWPTTARLCGLI